MAVQKPSHISSKIWASQGTVEVPEDTKINSGWTLEVPKFQVENWVQNRSDQFAAHVNERGIPEWDDTTDYIAGKSYVQGSNGKVYLAKTNSGPSSSVQNPTTDTSKVKWDEAFASKAGAVFKTGENGAAILPAGTTAQRPAPTEGLLRLNSDTGQFEGYQAGRWGDINISSKELFSGDNLTTEFQLSSSPESKDLLQVYISGVYQQKNTYELGGLSGDLLIFAEAPPVGVDNIEVVVSSLIPSDDRLRTELADASDPQKGAGMVGWERAPITSATTTVSGALSSQAMSVWEFANLITDKPVADDPSTWDWTPAFNGAIAAAAMSGGGVVTHTPGTYKILGTIYLVSRVVLEFHGVNLVGSGSNAVFETGWLNGAATQSNVGEYGTGHTGNGTHYLQHCIVRGVKVSNCEIGARLHRFNYGCLFENCDIAATEHSIFSTHGWSQQYKNNLFRQTMRLQDFVDWTIVEGNSFESIFNGPGLEIGQDQAGGEVTYGGSWTLSIRNNGFHGCQVGILVRIQLENCLIQGNHFENGQNLTEPTPRHIYGPTSLTSRRIVIEHNHLAATLPGVIAVEFAALRDSVIGKNDFVTSWDGTFAKHVVLNTSGTFGNEVEVPFSPTNAAPGLAMYSLADTNILRVRGGSNNSTLTQPYSEEWSGSGQYTLEKYRAKYRRVSNQIPFCTVSSGANTVIVDTFVDSPLPFGPTFPVLFSFNAGGATDTHNITGFVIGTNVTLLGNRRLSGSAGVATITASVNAGKLRLTISSLDDSANGVSGWVKEM